MKNKFKEKPVINKQSKRKSNFFVNVLDGSFLTNKWTVQQIPFLFYLVFLALVYITLAISAEKTHRQIKRLEVEISALTAQSASIKSKLSENSKQSVIVSKLKDKGLKENIESIITLSR